jgi:hypothetical protein
MSSESAFTTFSNGVSVYLTNSIFPAIIKGLAERGVSLTTDDLLEMTKIPTQKPSISIPSMNFGVPSMHTATTIPRSQEKQSGATCLYQFKRGANSGHSCTKKAVAGSQYCATSGHNPNAPKVLKAAAAPTVPGIAPGVAPSPQLNIVTPAPVGLDVTLYDVEHGAPQGVEPGLYCHVMHKFIIRNTPEGLVAIGVHSSQGIIPLSAEQTTIAQNLGLQVSCTETAQDDDDEDDDVMSTSQPQSTSLPGIQTLKTMPGVPNIPMIPQLSKMGLQKPNQFSGIPSISSIPMLSQIS